MRVTVIVDRRERDSELVGALEAIGVVVEMKTLPVGDYVLSDRVCIERKTVQDFESSMMSGRLFDQIDRLKKSYAAPMLLLEGDRSTFRLKSRVINGAIASLYIDYGIAVIAAHGAPDAAEIIASMAAHEQADERRKPSLKGLARAHTHEQFQEYIIGNLPGVGPKLARALLHHFKNVRNISNASTEELMDVDKIGRKKAEAIHHTFNHEYRTDAEERF